MTTIYWQSPLWQPALLLFLGALVAVGIMFKRRRSTLADLIDNWDAQFGQTAIFFFEPAGGVRSITAAASEYLASPNFEGQIEAALAAAYQSGNVQREVDWPERGLVLTAIPVGPHAPAGAAGIGGAPSDATGRAAVAVIGNAHLAPLAAQAEEGERWISVGGDLRVHADRPQVKVRRRDNGGVTWHETSLAGTEDAVLRHLMKEANQVCSAEDLFAAAWPEESSGRGGLRPDQRDRLRRLIFQLRQRIEPVPAEPRYVATAHGVGYALYATRHDE